MKIIDISWPITPTMTEYKDQKTVIIKTTTKHEPYVQESTLSFKSHIGTHVDAPAHFLPTSLAIDQIPLSSLIGSCKVLDLTHLATCINADDLQHADIGEHDIIVFKTNNSFLSPTQAFDFNFIYLAASAASLLAEKKVKAVGIDYLGIERNQPDHQTHKTLLQQNIPIIEGLRLAHVHPGNYMFFCLPLNIIGIDAAPARAILIQNLTPRDY